MLDDSARIINSLKIHKIKKLAPDFSRFDCPTRRELGTFSSGKWSKFTVPPGHFCEIYPIAANISSFYRVGRHTSLRTFFQHVGGSATKFGDQPTDRVRVTFRRAQMAVARTHAPRRECSCIRFATCSCRRASAWIVSAGPRGGAFNRIGNCDTQSVRRGFPPKIGSIWPLRVAKYLFEI